MRHNLCFIFCLCALLSCAQTMAQEVRPDRSKYIDLGKIFKMRDPLAAADELERLAVAKGVDMHHVDPDYFYGDGAPKRDEISLPFIGVFRVQSIDESFRESISSAIEHGRGEEPNIFIIQLNRNLSIGEYISLLRSGIRFHSEHLYNAYIVGAPLRVVAGLMDSTYVRWVGLYRPDYKYAPDSFTPADTVMHVLSFESDGPQFRDDLTSLGAKILKYSPSFGQYLVVARIERIPLIAQLWWVKSITPLIHARNP